MIFVYWGLQVKWNQFSSNNSRHSSCIHKGLHAGKWPDLMTPKPDYVRTLGYHWTDHTGRPLEPQVHWDGTGTTPADASLQWCSSGDPVVICIIGTHWKTTGRPLETHWLLTILYPVAFQCTLGSKFQAHWIAIGLPLDYHWLRVIPQSHWPNRHETDLKPTKMIKFRERSVYSQYWFGFVGLVSVYVRADKFVGEPRKTAVVCRLYAGVLSVLLGSVQGVSVLIRPLMVDGLSVLDRLCIGHMSVDLTPIQGRFKTESSLI